MDRLIKDVYDGILNGENNVVPEKIKSALGAGLSPAEILNEGMVSAMAEVGRRFEMGEYYVPEMLISARAMQAGLAVLKPYLKEANVEATGKVAICTVKGDLHDIGKNLVAMMLEGAGFEIQDLGTDVPPEKIVSIADSVDLIALSALLTTTVTNMKDTIEALQKAGKRSKVKVIVGGAPVTEEFARRIGADGYAPDASRATSLAKSLMSK